MIHKRCKLIALLMSVLLLVSVPLFPMHADEEANLLIISDNVAVSSSQVSERQDDPADSNSIINSSSNETQLIIPEIIQDHELCRNFVSRRFEEEKSLYDLVFENEDHTLTSFIYQTPVKYVTEEGDVRDISTELYVISGSVAEPLKKDTNSMQLTKEQASDVLNGIYAKGTVAFGSLDNRVRSWYPENIGDGIGLTDGIYSIRMTPKTDVGLNAKAAADQNSVLYADVFEENITIRYTPTWNGIKEEIILFSVPEGNSFQFLLNCEGSMIRESEDSIIVTSLETGQTIGSFDPILVYDADGRLTTGSISLQNTDQGQLLTITVDPAFFISAAYPVTIDPSLSFYNVEDGFSWFIQEAGLYSDSGAWGSSFNTMHYVGMNPIDNDYSGRILYRFPVLWDEYYPFHNFYPDQIVSFELHMSTTPSTVSQFCSLYTDFYNSSSWTHGNRICDATAYNNIAWGHYEWTTRSNDDSEITADITQKSKLWISYMRGLTSLSYANPYNGIAVICMQEDTEHCTVKAVSPYGSNLVQTYVTITYRDHSYMGDFYINNLDSRLFWNRLGFTSQGTMTDLGNTVRWTSELVVDGSVPKYAIHPYESPSFYIGQNGSIAYFYDSYCLWRFEEDTYGVKIVNDVTGELLVENSDYPYISTTSTDTGLSCRWRFIRPSAYREVTLASLAIEELYGQKDIPQSVLPKLIRYNVDFVDAEDFRIDPVDITSATGSINGLVTGLVEIDFQRVSITHIPTGICKNFSFYTTISDGTYFIKNAETRMFAQLCDSDGPYYSSSNAPIEGWAFDGEAYQRWQFIHLGDGYFKILSQQSGKALSVKSGYANSSTEPLVQYTYSYGNSLQRWKIDWNSSGRFILRPESGESYSTDWCMCYGIYSSIPEGVTIRQNGYVNDSNCNDEWELFDANGYLGLLSCWNSTSDRIAFWNSGCLVVYQQSYVNDSSFNYNFTDGVNNAIEQWKNALGITIVITSDKNDADIICYAVDDYWFNQLTYETWPDGVIGITDFSSIPIGYAMYNSEPQDVLQFTHATIYILYDLQLQSSLLGGTIVHEFGHALGYLGHSQNSSDVMYANATGNSLLSVPEKNHLSQIYNLLEVC